MTNKNNKRLKNDLRRENVDRLTGEKHKHKLIQEKINEADKDLRDFCFTNKEERSFADE